MWKNRMMKYMKICIYWMHTVRCTPDWHTENKSISYVLWILIVGFVIPASITVITSFVTCFQIYRVSFKVFPCAGHLLMLYIIYTKIYVYLLFYSYAYSSHLMNCAAHRSKETKKLFNWFWPWTYHICFAGLHMQLYVFYAYLSQKGNDANKLSCCISSHIVYLITFR